MAAMEEILERPLLADFCQMLAHKIFGSQPGQLSANATVSRKNWPKSELFDGEKPALQPYSTARA